MNRSAAVTVVIALVLVSASRAEADAVRITSGFVGVDLVDFQPTLADLSGPGIALTGKIFPTTGLPCLFDCANGSVVDPSGVYTFLAGDLFGFFGHARVGNIMASNADATLKFVAQPFRAPGSGSVSFTMSGRVRLFGNDEGSILGESAIVGGGTARVGLEENFDNKFTLASLDFAFGGVAATPEPTPLVLVGAALGAGFLNRKRSAHA
jgi:hypothetical protein